MPLEGFLTITVVTGLLVLAVALLVARSRRTGGYVFERDRPTPDRSTLALVAVVVVAALLGAVALLVDPVAVVYLALAALVVGFGAWGVYSLARFRGLPPAHSVGLSAWLFGVVLIGVVTVKLLLG
jgi:hypothetical protein